MQSRVVFSQASTEWETPADLFWALDEVFHFDVDVCATHDNAKCYTYYTEKDNALRQQWRGACWMNPPFGRGIVYWMQKAVMSVADHGATVVCLLPARTDTQWWHEYVIPYGEIHFLCGRLKFSGHQRNAPFPCAVVVFRPSVADALTQYYVRKKGK